MPEKHKRESGIELLRILAMLLIVIGHVPRFYAFGPTADGFMLALLADAGRIAVNLFLLVGVWFMVEAPFRPEAPLRLHLTVLAYALPLTLAGGLLGLLPAADTLRCFFPLVGRPLWFVASYLSLMLLAPFLSRAADAVGPALGRLVLLLSVFTCGVCSLPDPQLSYFGDTAWFAFVYLFMRWFKRSAALAVVLRWRALLFAAGLALYAALVVCSCFGPGPSAALADQYLFDFKTLPNFLVALCLFCFFVGLRLGTVPAINAVARPALAVYVFHQMPSFVPTLWGVVLPVGCLKGTSHAGLWLILTALAVYAIASVLEVLRMRLVEPFVLRSRPFVRLRDGLVRFYRPLTGEVPSHG